MSIIIRCQPCSERYGIIETSIWIIISLQLQICMQGSVVVWAELVVEQHRESGKVVQKSVKKPQVFHEDIIGDAFWEKYPHVLQ